jgi:hypothetical protein
LKKFYPIKHTDFHRSISRKRIYKNKIVDKVAGALETQLAAMGEQREETKP